MEWIETFTSLAYIPAGEVILRLALAAICAFLLGWDRESRQKSFGLRTHMLLSVGTAAFVLILMEMTYSYRLSLPPGSDEEVVRIDLARIVQAVIVGIGFLAAGSIIQANDKVKGATTSAGVWVLGGIGLAAGLGLYLHTIIITILVLLIVVALHPLDNIIMQRQDTKGKI